MLSCSRNLCSGLVDAAQTTSLTYAIMTMMQFPERLWLRHVEIKLLFLKIKL